MEDQEARPLAAKATELFMAQVWRERGKPLNTPVDAQLVQFEKELALQIYLHLSVLGDDTSVMLERTSTPDLGPVWHAIQAAGIDPVYIGSHLHYRVTADGRVETVQPLRKTVPPWPDNQELAQRRFLVSFSSNRWAVVDSKTGALYGIVKWDPAAAVSGVTDRLTPGEWDVRDWEDLSLPFHDTITIVDARNPSLRCRDGFANRLVYRADRKGGLPVLEDPEEALGIVGDFLFLPGGGARRFNVYTVGGTHLGNVESPMQPLAQGIWWATPAAQDEKLVYDIAEAFTRAGAAAQLAAHSGL